MIRVRILTAAILGAGLSSLASADPKSDLFQPDVFRTGSALHERTPGLKDPMNETCPTVQGPLTLRAAWIWRCV